MTDYIRNTVSVLWARAGDPATNEQFHVYLKQELQEDYLLTLEQLTDLVTKSNNGCCLLEEPLEPPAVFSEPNSLSVVTRWLQCGNT